ncbi:MULTISPECIES: DUF7408 domain-containing protein [Falsihalocynthiibacter]|uniref:DUF7408 domain-containing protein n=1 Tax=Falsihalocynthiibacter TaxID=2854182 RepID=UPI003002C34A
MTQTILFDPLLPLPLILFGIVTSVFVVGFSYWRGLFGWPLRSFALTVLFLTLLNPALQSEDRDAMSDIVLILQDKSSSQSLSDREAQNASALAALRQKLAALPNTDIHEVSFGDGEADSGTTLFGALSAALAEIPEARVAGIVILSDGQAHDIPTEDALNELTWPAPIHTLLSGRKGDWDRRLVLSKAPGFGIIGEPVMLTVLVEDQGAVPPDVGPNAPLLISIDGGPTQSFEVPIGQELELPLTLAHGGLNVVQFVVPMADTELTDRNNTAVLQINGVRDRLRVLLVSGEPHPGERTWRNLLKSDSSVDLVHFTILRPPEKQDGVPVSELSLIAFPTRELFLEKIDDFDLIIFDRYKRRGILPASYLENVANYVRRGGAVLLAAGPDFASVESLYFSALSEILPAEPTARVLDEEFRPKVTETGQKHPVTEGLQAGPEPEWGRWLRMVELEAKSGHTVMSGKSGAPLLQLDRVGEGRVALLASDHAWLWHRGFDGGGPQLELLRRLAHWMMKEPELEEEALSASAVGLEMKIVRRTLGGDDAPAPDLVTITAPDGSLVEVPLVQSRPGLFETTYFGTEFGLYRLSQGALSFVIGMGPAAPREFVETVATSRVLAPLITPTQGGILNMEDGTPDVRTVRSGRNASGAGWIGFVPRGAFVTTGISVSPLVPAWILLVLITMMSIAAWLREGRR